MTKRKESLEELRQIADELLANAIIMTKMVEQPFVEEEVAGLQLKQTQLIKSFQNLEKKFSENSHPFMPSESQLLEEIHAVLNTFQEENARFVERVKDRFELIEFTPKLPR